MSRTVCCMRVPLRRLSRPWQLHSRRLRGTAPSAAVGQMASEATLSSQAVLDRYRALLHEYRQHKQSLGDWLGAFMSSCRRPPQLLDVQATGDPELLARFQQYLMVRKRLLAEIPLLREELAEAAAAESQHVGSSTGSGTSSSSSHKHHNSHKHGAVNVNQAAPISKSQAVGQFFAAVSYRREQGSLREQGSRTGQDSSSQGSSSSSSSSVPVAGSAIWPGAAVEAGVDQLASVEGQLLVDAVISNPAQHAAGLHGGNSSPERKAASVSSLATATGSTHSSSSNGSEAGAAHLLAAATGQGHGSSSGSRATAAALAALAYRKQRQQGAPENSSMDQQQQQLRRNIAVLQAETPRLPAGIDAAAAAAGGVVLGVVETGKGDVYGGRQRRRELESDVSLEATLQGVPGGLGSSADTLLFATAVSVQSTGPAMASSSDSSSSSSSSSSSIVASGSVVSGGVVESSSGEPAGQVMTARYDVYAGRNRVLQARSAGLDECFAGGLEVAATAAATAAAGTALPAEAASDDQAAALSKQHPEQVQGQQQQQHSGRHASGNSSCIGNSSSSSNSSFGGMQQLGLSPEIMPLPT